MRKNWLARGEANAVKTGARRAAAVWARTFRARPIVPDAEFQSADEPYPGHWRRFPERWLPAGGAPETAVAAAVAELPETWQQVLLRHDVAGLPDAQVAAGLELDVEQERDILARARAAVRDRLENARVKGQGP
jgi:RNA polymerase sigma-70 factor (ECF subfamily)